LLVAAAVAADEVVVQVAVAVALGVIALEVKLPLRVLDMH
jgi:hypothetical protein